MPPGSDMGMMLCNGEVEALISPQPRASMLAQPDRYRRLFPDVHAEEVSYFRTYGYYPIMHLMVLKRDLAERFTELPRELMRIFDDAKQLAYGYYADSNYSLLVDGRTLYEQQREDFGADPWLNGFKANRANLDRFIGYSHDQRLIASPYPAEKLFHPSTYDT
jgi:4,5-dihydroxyphthalate decarboxylase